MRGIYNNKSGHTSESWRVIDSVLYYAVYSVVKLLSLLPFTLLYLLSDALFFPLYYLVRYRRKVVHRNLKESFPAKTDEEIMLIEKRFYHFFIDVVLESCKLLSISPEEMKRRMNFVNMDILREMLAGGKSVSVFLGHYGNWEWISSSGLWFDKPGTVAQVYHPLRNKPVDRIMLKIRRRMGNACVEMTKTVRYVAELKDSGTPRIMGLIADQSPAKNGLKHFLRFLNHEVPVLTGSEKVTKHFGLDAVFLGMKRVKRGYYECNLSMLHENPASLPDYELTRLFFERLEAEIERQPECYLWSHKRFKYARNKNEHVEQATSIELYAQ